MLLVLYGELMYNEFAEQSQLSLPLRASEVIFDSEVSLCGEVAKLTLIIHNSFAAAFFVNKQKRRMKMHINRQSDKYEDIRRQLYIAKLMSDAEEAEKYRFMSKEDSEYIAKLMDDSDKNNSFQFERHPSDLGHESPIQKSKTLGNTTLQRTADDSVLREAIKRNNERTELRNMTQSGNSESFFGTKNNVIKNQYSDYGQNGRRENTYVQNSYPQRNEIYIQQSRLPIPAGNLSDKINSNLYCRTDSDKYIAFINPAEIEMIKNRYSSRDEEKMDFIYGQGQDTNVKDLDYGNSKISGTGCELIAIYNSLLMHEEGKNSQKFTDIISDAENTKGVMVLDGEWGSNPYLLGKLFNKYNQDYKATIDSNDFNSFLEKDGVYVVSFWNKSWIKDGLHTVAFTCDEKNNIVVYNRFNSSKGPITYKAIDGKTGLDLLLDETNGGIILYKLE